MKRHIDEVYRQLQARRNTWLVTGAAGFIGSHLVERLLVLNQKVTGLDNFSTGYARNLRAVRDLVGQKHWSNFSFVEGDIRDFEACREAVQGIDCVLHQAAIGSVPRSIDNPILTHQVNVDGFLNVIVASRDAGVSRFVFAASSSSYGDSTDLPKREDVIGNPLSPYAVTKSINEMYAAVFARVYGFGSIGLRYFNVFGPRQDPEGAYAAVIPRWMAATIRGDEVFINGDGETTRDFCYVENAVQANLLAATTENVEALNQVYNVACGENITLNTLYSKMQQALQERSGRLMPAPVKYRAFRDGDVRHSLADISKARRVLQYEPTHSVSAGIVETADWYLSTLPSI